MRSHYGTVMLAMRLDTAFRDDGLYLLGDVIEAIVGRR